MRKHTDDQLKFVGIVVKSEVKEHLYLCTHRVLYDVFIVISPRSKSATSLDREVLLAMLADVTTLSDDERAEPATLASSSVASLTQLEESVCRTQPSRKRKVTAEMQMMIDCEMRRSVRHVVSSNCRCFRKGKSTNKRNCYHSSTRSSSFGKHCAPCTKQMLTKLHLINNTSNNSLVLGLNLFVTGVLV